MNDLLKQKKLLVFDNMVNNEEMLCPLFPVVTPTANLLKVVLFGKYLNVFSRNPIFRGSNLNGHKVSLKGNHNDEFIFNPS